MLNNLMFTMLGATGPTIIDYDAAQITGWVLMILMVLVSIALTVVIMMQKSTGEDMSAITGSSKNESFFGKNKSQSKEGILRKTTVILSVSLLVLSIAYFIILSL